MTLASGTRLGPYEVLGLLGVGGMGEVYRASDTKLKREVAIKVLPEAFARDEARMKRFEREAQVLASLNHPNVAAIYGLEEAESPEAERSGVAEREAVGAGPRGTERWIRALVLELVEGPTLAERIASGPIPLEEAIRIATQIANGLEAAHEKAIIHRDLKPANVKLTKDGDVKILDFGLAKALEVESTPVENTNSPTLTRATQAGVLLGTAAYMSPEQAKGKSADRRADVWAFGVVLYEMLAGRRAFDGEDLSETLAFVLTKEPDWSALPAELPVPVRGLLTRCLTKDPKQRLQAIGEARIALDYAMGEAPETAVAPARTQSTFWPALAGAAFLALGATLWTLWPRPALPPPPPIRLSARLGADASLVTWVPYAGPAAVLSPDGALLAFVGEKGPGEAPQLYVRRLEELEASPLPGTEGARSPFFSPDSQWIAFFAQGNLKKVAVTSGATVTLCEARNERGGGAWAEDGTIVFALFEATGGGLSRVSSAGGTPEILTNPADAGEVAHRSPQALPGGRVLYTAFATAGGYDDATIVAQPLPSGPKKILLRGGYQGRYVPSGHIVYIREGTLFATAFDLDRLEVTGEPVPAVEGVTSNLEAQFAVSDRGSLVYLPGPGVGTDLSIDWMDSAGKPRPLRAVRGDYGNPRFSPDGSRLALDVRDGSQSDVWVYEWERDTPSRLTFDPGVDTRPIWTPDGTRITFASDRADKRVPNLYWQRADGTGEVERLTESKNPQYPASWHPSGRFLAFFEGSPKASADLHILPIEGSEAAGWKPGNATVFLSTAFAEMNPEFSPDGRWLAYQANASGKMEVYVRPFPGPGGVWQVSTESGANPIWSRTRRELFYCTVDQRIMVASYTGDGDKFRAEKPRLWSEGRFAAPLITKFLDLHPDGERFAAVTTPQAQSLTKQDEVVFILNFFDYLRRIAPAQGSR